MFWKMLALGMLAGIPAVAGALPAAQTFTDQIQAEDVAPVVPAVAVSASQKVAVSLTESPFEVKGVAVTLSSTTGFDRDRALEIGARRALPGVLQGMGMLPAKASETARVVGDPMTFVASYVIVKESLIPTYGVVVDYVFQESLLRSNFGGLKKEVVSDSVVVGVSSTEVSASAVGGGARYLVRVPSGDPVAQNKVFNQLRGLKGAKVSYRLLASAGSDFDVEVPMDEQELERALQGSGAVVIRATEPPLVDPATGGGAGASPVGVSRGGMPVGDAYSPDLLPVSDVEAR